MRSLPNERTELHKEPALDDSLISREWLKLAAKGSPMGLWDWNEETRYVFWDAKACEIFGVKPGGKIPLETFYRCLHPDDREHVVEVWRHQLEKRLPFDLEYRSVRPDGSIRWVHALGSGYYDELGTPLRMVGVIFDITERKEADQERLDLAGRLINAQERERSRLASELHDDFLQRLAMFTCDLARAEEMVMDPHVRGELHKLWGKIDEIGADLRSVSHRLHSSTLDVLGLTAGVRSFCAEFSSQHAIEVEFANKGIPKSTNPETSLCLFRIVQEGLRNVKRHSGATHAQVRIETMGDTLHLSISDDGAGYDVNNGAGHQGLGLRSMRERVRLIGGRFEIHSKIRRGTRIDVWAPVGE